MCWSASVSLNTFIFSFFGTCFALFNGVIDIPRALFYLSFMSMQLVEYFAWKNPSNTRIPSMAGLFLIFIQIPLLIYSKYNGPHKNLLYALWFAVSMIGLATTQIKFTMHKAPNGHFAWDWLNSFSIFYILIFILFYAGIHKSDLLVSSFLYVTTAFSLYTYWKEGTFGSMWCWFSNLIAFYVIYQVFRKEMC